MKKILFGILTFLGIGLSFCSALEFTIYGDGNSYSPNTFDVPFDSSGFTIIDYSCSNNYCGVNLTDPYACMVQFFNPDNFTYDFEYCGDTFKIGLVQNWNTFDYLTFSIGGGGEEDTGSVSTIDVYYNNGNSTETITCDGTQAIEIQGLSTITSTNTFTPYFNISYTDEDNQKLIESYSKDILYLENGQFKKTYTGDNERILTYEGSSENTFTGYVPVFDFTGDTIVNSGNVFNNFSDNALKVLLSNIPSYIQYITIFMILVFLFSFIRRFKRKS